MDVTTPASTEVGFCTIRHADPDMGKQGPDMDQDTAPAATHKDLPVTVPLTILSTVGALPEDAAPGHPQKDPGPVPGGRRAWRCHSTQPQEHQSCRGHRLLCLMTAPQDSPPENQWQLGDCGGDSPGIHTSGGGPATGRGNGDRDPLHHSIHGTPVTPESQGARVGGSCRWTDTRRDLCGPLLGHRTHLKGDPPQPHLHPEV